MANLFSSGSEQHVLRTQLNSEQCCERLQHQVGQWNWYLYPIPEQPLRGVVSKTGFTLRKTTRYRNDFQPVASGKLASAPDGTRIEVRLATAPGGSFFTFWLGLWLFMLIVVVPFVIVRSFFRSVPLFIKATFLAAVIPLCLLLLWAFAQSLFDAGRLRGSEESAFLLNFLRETLEAEDLTNVSA